VGEGQGGANIYLRHALPYVKYAGHA